MSVRFIASNHIDECTDMHFVTTWSVDTNNDTRTMHEAPGDGYFQRLPSKGRGDATRPRSGGGESIGLPLSGPIATGV